MWVEEQGGGEGGPGLCLGPERFIEYIIVEEQQRRDLPGDSESLLVPPGLPGHWKACSE